MTFRLLIATLAALSILGASVADAATRKQKRQKVYRGPAPVVVTTPAPRVFPDPTMGRGRPAWAGPNECFTDEGYGRYTPCDIGRDNF
jgi:hypothetical protein